MRKKTEKHQKMFLKRNSLLPLDSYELRELESAEQNIKGILKAQIICEVRNRTVDLLKSNGVKDLKEKISL